MIFHSMRASAFNAESISHIMQTWHVIVNTTSSTTTVAKNNHNIRGDVRNNILKTSAIKSHIRCSTVKRSMTERRTRWKQWQQYQYTHSARVFRLSDCEKSKPFVHNNQHKSHWKDVQ